MPATNDLKRTELSSSNMTLNAQSGIACKTCRRRGRKCDRTLPKCMSCHRRSVPCEGYAMRWVGLAARGKLAGQTFESATDDSLSRIEKPSVNLSSDSPKSEESLNLAVFYPLSPHRAYQDRKRLSYLPPGHMDPCSKAMTVLNHQRAIIPTALRPADSVDSFVNYYAREISTAFYLGHGPADTPYTRYILPMTKDVPCIRYAVAATASCHIGNRLYDDSLKTQSLCLRLNATEALRRQLMDDADEANISNLACMVLLAQLDLCSGDCLEYETHLKAASDIIKRCGSDGTELAFFQQRVAWLDIMGATTSPRIPYLEPQHVKAALNRCITPTGRKWGFDVFDCPIDLFEYLAEIVFLDRLHKASHIPSGEALKRAAVLGNAIMVWTESDAESGVGRRDIVQIWRHGILLYLARLFPLTDEMFDAPGLRDDVFQRTRRLSSTTSRKFATSWPLFQAGLCLTTDCHERKQWLRNDFAAHFKTHGCCNPKLAIEVLEQAWLTGEQPTDSQRLLF